MNNDARLYIAGLAWAVTSDQLRETFEGVGEVVSAEVISDRMSGRSRGFGFVEMGTPELAQESIEKLNGQEVHGREIMVNIARPMTPRD